MAGKVGTGKSVRLAFASWRLLSVTLLSFSSGLPLGLVVTAIPYWMQQEGIDIKTIGLITAAQLPYTFKFLWSPFMDRFAPRRARKRAWIVVGQLLLASAVAALGAFSGAPTMALVAALTFLVTLASATQDIAIDGYTVEVLRPEEQGLAVGARVAFYRAAMFISGAVTVTLGPKLGWPLAFGAIAVFFLALIPVALLAPEAETVIAAPRTLKEAVWEPFVGFFQHSRALEIAAFLFLYKFADNLTQALVRPFLGQLGFDSVDVGLASGTVGLIATLVGTFWGGLLTGSLGLSRALWLFGLLQAVAGLGYAALAEVGWNRPLMYSAMALEAFASGLGNGAFGVLLLRLTQRQFSATQYALFSGLFALNRSMVGPPAGAMVDAMGWRNFFLASVLFAIPGLVMLQRFAPWGQRDVEFVDAAPRTGVARAPLSWPAIATRGLCAVLLGTLVSYASVLCLSALKFMRAGAGFNLQAALAALLHPGRAADWIDVAAPPILGVVVGLAVSAALAARRKLDGPPAAR